MCSAWSAAPAERYPRSPPHQTKLGANDALESNQAVVCAQFGVQGPVAPDSDLVSETAEGDLRGLLRAVPGVADLHLRAVCIEAHGGDQTVGAGGREVVDAGDHVAGLQPGLRRRAAGREVLQRYAGGGRQRGVTAGAERDAERGVGVAAVRDQLRGDSDGEIRRDGEADADVPGLAAVAGGAGARDRGVDP